MNINFAADGTAEVIYTEKIDLRKLGKLKITRASHVEPDINGQWTADMSPVKGPILGPYDTRDLALSAEVKWLESNLF